MKFPNSFNIETDRFKLSPIREADIESVFETMNSRGTADIISFLKWPMNLEQATSWCRRSEKGFNEQRELLFLARSKLDATPVGCIFIYISSDLRTGEVGYWVSENWQGCGSASEMLKAVIDFAFYKCDLSRLVATAAFENPISLRILQKFGFYLIGQKNLPTAKGTILTCHLLELQRKEDIINGR